MKDNKNLLDKDLYEDQPEVFQNYLDLTTQKPILIERVVQKLQPIAADCKDFTFMDIGCSNGLVTLPIARKLKQLTDLEVVGIDESAEAINTLKEQANFPITGIQENAEKTEPLPSADFILMAHLFWFIENPDSFLDKVVVAISPDGLGLIVLNNKESQGAKINNPDPESERLLLSEKVQGLLKEKDIRFETEVVESTIDVACLEDMDEAGRLLVAFFKHDEFKNIPKADVEEFRQKMLETAGDDGKLIKREDYIWIYK